jgi:undecaprenyl-diphosphatase
MPQLQSQDVRKTIKRQASPPLSHQLSIARGRPPWMVKMRSINFVALVAVFVIFSIVVGSGATFSADDAAIRYFKSIQGNSGTDTAMIVITSLGDVTTLFLFGIVITIIRRTRKVGMVFLIVLVVLVIAVMYTKPLVGRPVPPYVFVPAVQLPDNFSLENDSLAPIAFGLSYPSGHAARAVALAFVVGYALYKKSRWAGYAIWIFPVIIGISRVYLMQHYPTDIIGGFIFGGILSIVLSNAMKLDQPFLMSRFKGKEGEAPQDGMRR